MKNNPTIAASIDAWIQMIAAMPMSQNDSAWHKFVPQKHGDWLEMNALAWRDLAEALAQYALWQQSPSPRDEGAVIWREGDSQLLHLGGEGAPVLLVPSMINGHDILHQPGEASLANFLKAEGFRIYLLNWGDRVDHDRALTVEGFQSRLQNAVSQIGECALLGYCLGGTLAQLTDLPYVSRQVLMGTPWRFHHNQGRVGAFAQFLHAKPEEALEAPLKFVENIFGLLPAVFVDQLFLMLNPLQFVEKFRHRGERADCAGFDALENWLCSGRDLPVPFARKVLLSWFREDALVSQTGLNTRETLAVFGRRDHIAPPLSCCAIEASGQSITLCEHDAGHVGLLVGTQSRRRIWPKIGEFLKSK